MGSGANAGSSTKECLKEGGEAGVDGMGECRMYGES